MNTLSVNTLSRIATRSCTSPTQSVAGRCYVHESRLQHTIMMPAMSPLMTEGTIKCWKKKEGEQFFPGDVLLQIESDIAMIDVHAENAGIIAKILIPEGTANVPVEKVIALVAKNPQEHARLQAQAHIRTPPLPPLNTSLPSHAQPRRPPSPLPVDQASSPRSASARRSSFRLEAHLANNPAPPIRAGNAGAVRGMGTNHVRTLSLPGSTPAPALSPSRWSTLAAEAARNVPGSSLRKPESTLAGEDKHVIDGPSLRKIICSNLSRNSPSSPAKQTGTAKYFEGIL